MLKSLICSLIVVALAVTAAQASVIQIDLNQPNVAGAGWNTIGGNTTGFALTDSMGAPTSATADVAGWEDSGSNGQMGAFAGTVFDPAAQDYLWLDSNGTSRTATVIVSGLTGSAYMVQVASARATSSTPGDRNADIQVNGVYADSTPNGEDFDSYADGFTNGSILIWNAVAPVGGQITVAMTCTGNAPGSSVVEQSGHLNAFILTEVPEPATMGLLALGGLAMLRRKR